MTKLFAAAAAATAILSVVPGIATADPVWQVGQGYVIRYQDLDLSSAQGRAALLVRIERAADRACRDEMLRVDEQACRQRIAGAAMANAAGPARQALHMAMNERGPVLASR
jgi:UrcA family protein